MSTARLALVGVCALLALALRLPAQGPAAQLTARNLLDLARPAETIAIEAAELQRVLKVDDLRRVHVREHASGPELLVQAIDLDDNGTFDQVVFQADFSSRQTRTFTLTVGDRHVYARDQFRAYGRFVRERRDDFAWENDRVAHRMYGEALETWAQEPLTSSGVDVWVKRTRRLVINDWYMVDDYHRDTGEGGDLYSVGKTRGCGGTGVMVDGRLYTSKNFRQSRVLANGPIRVLFELVYEPWTAGGITVSEVKRVSLDAGHNLSRFESRYTATPADAWLHAVGIKKAAAAQTSVDLRTGILRTWEPIKDAGFLGCGVVLDPSLLAGSVEVDGNVLLTARVPPTGTIASHAGFGWDRSGDFATLADWDRYLREYAERLRAPVQVTLGPR